MATECPPRTATPTESLAGASMYRARRDLLLSLPGRQLARIVADTLPALPLRACGRARRAKMLAKHWDAVRKHDIIVQAVQARGEDSDIDLDIDCELADCDGMSCEAGPSTPRECFVHNLPDDILCLAFDNLSLADALSVLRVNWQWRAAITDHSPIWTRLLSTRFPNLADLIDSGVVPAERAGFLGRMRQERDPHWPIRAPKWMSSVCTRASPTWRVKAVLFYYDVSCEGVPLVSVTHRRFVDEHGNLIAQDCDHRETHKWCCLSTSMVGRLRLQLDGDKECSAIERFVQHAQKLTQEGREWAADVPLHAAVSYRLEGEGVPERAPVCLMSEGIALFATKCHAAFRTDVQGEYIPKDVLAFANMKKKKNAASMTRAKNLKAPDAMSFWQRYTARHGSSQLPFDPTLEVYVTTRSMNTSPDERDVHIEGDREGICSVEVLPGFARGGDWQVDFAEVLPVLAERYCDA